MIEIITVENPNPELFDLFDKVFTTNSKYDFYGTPNKDKTGINEIKNLEIIKLF